ncbi:MAG: hypothetical protein AVDCRST_MAG45-142, partial [uncultured Solirubrobacterales bacterium]
EAGQGRVVGRCLPDAPGDVGLAEHHRRRAKELDLGGEVEPV